MPSAEPGLVRVSTEMFPEQERFAAFREDYVRRVLAMDVIDRSDGRPRVDLTFMPLGPVVFGTSAATPIEFVRQRHHARDGKDGFSFGITATGMHRCDYAGEERLFEPGSVGLVHLARPWRTISGAGSTTWNVTLPEAALKSLVPHPEDLAGRPVHPGPAVRLLKSYLSSLVAVEDPLPPDLASTVGAHLLDLVAAALGPTAAAAEVIAGRGVKAARMREIQAAIERRSSEPGFDLDRLSAALGLSRRYVQQVLEDTGRPFSLRLAECRLARALALLTDRRCDHLSVADIAFAAGFGDVSHFNRTFRRRFGDTPSGIRAAATMRPPAPADGRP